MSPIFSEIWTIDAAQKRQWEEILEENGITEDYIQSVFSAHNAAVIRFGTVSNCIKRKPNAEPDLLAADPALLWSDDRVAVYMPPEPRVLNHLWVLLKRPVENCVEVTSDEMVEIRAIVKKIQFFFTTHFEATVLIAQWHQPQTGYFPGHFMIELIPNRPEAAKVFDAWDKAECNEYLH